MKIIYPSLCAFLLFAFLALNAAGPGVPNNSYNSQFQFLEKFDYDDDLREGQGYVTMHQGYLLMPFSKDGGGGEGTGGFTFYDISNPTNPQTTFTTLGNSKYENSSSEDYVGDMREPHGFTISNNNIWCMTMNDVGKSGLQFWDISDVESANGPERLSEISLPNLSGGDYSSTVWWVHWQGRYAYAAGTSQGLMIVDAQDPSNPQYIKRISNNNLGALTRASVVSAIGNLLVITASDSDGICTLDISDPINPVLLDSTSENVQYSSTVNGHLLFGAKDPAVIFDISNPSNITKLGSGANVADKGGYGVVKDNVFVYGSSSKMVLLDYTNPNSPSVIGTNDPDQDAVFGDTDWDFATVLGNLVFQGNDHEGSALVVYDKDPDLTPPVVNMVIPVNNAVNQNVKSRVGITLTDQVLTETIDETTFIVRPLGGSALTGVYTNQLGMLNFSPDQELQDNTTYEVIIPVGGLQDFAGNPIQQEFRSLFSTGSQIVQINVGIDLTSPKAVGSTVNFNASVSGASNPQYSWDFGDGTIVGPSTSSSASHTYASKGNYTVEVTVQSGGSSVKASTSQVIYSAPAVIEPTHSSSIIFDSSNNLVLNVNPDNDTVTALSLGSVPAPVTVDVSVVPGDFTPDPTINVGDTVRWTWTGGGNHSTTSVAGLSESWDSGLHSTGHVFEHTFTTAGTFEYYCTPHGTDNGNGTASGMAGVITVLPSAPLNVSKAWETSVGKEPVSLALAPANELWVLNQDDADITVVSRSTGNVIDSIALPYASRPYGIAFAPNQSAAFVTLEATGILLKLDPNSGAVLDSLDLNAKIRGVAVTPDSSRVLVTRFVSSDAHGEVFDVDVASMTLNDTVILEIDTAPDTEDGGRGLPNYMSSIVISPDGTEAWVPSKKDNIQRGLVRDGLEMTFESSVRSIVSRIHLDGSGQQALPSGNQVLNASFESGGSSPSSWSLSAAATGSTESSTAGSSSLKISGSGSLGTTSQVIALSPNTDYELSVWINASGIIAGNAVFDTNDVFDPNPSGGNPGGDGQFVVGSNSGDWVEYIGNFNSADMTSVTLRMFTNSSFSGTVYFDEVGLYALQSASNRIDFNDRDMGTGAIYSKYGNYLFVGQSGSNTIEIVDVYVGHHLGSISSTGRMVRNLAVSDDGRYLFAHNFLSRTVDVFDISSYLQNNIEEVTLVTTISVVANEKLSNEVLDGKRIFYNANDNRMNRDGYISCASCHLDGGQDGRVWDFTDRGEGLRNTITLRGRSGTGHGMIHWSANFDEVQDFEHDIRGPFGGSGFMSDTDFNSGTRNTTLGTPKSGVSQALDNLAAYVSSLTDVPNSPHRNSDGSLTIAAERGKLLFNQKGCFECHSGSEFTDSKHKVLHDIGTDRMSSGQRMGSSLLGLDTPSLLGIWNTAPYLHDGSAATLEDVLTSGNTEGLHGEMTTLSQSERNDLVEYLLQIDENEIVADEAPLVTFSNLPGHLTAAENEAISVQLESIRDDSLISQVQFFENGSLSSTQVAGPYVTNLNISNEHGIGATVDFVDGSSSTLLPRVISKGDDSVAVVFNAKVNFQPSGAATPSGYMADRSQTYADRGNGYTYGWTAAFDETRERNVNADKRLDTLNHLQKGGLDQVWEIAVPNGDYTITAAGGDPSHDNGFIHLVAEEGTANEVDVVNGSPAGVFMVSGTATVTVTDGKLTISSGSSADNNKICYIDIDSIVSATTPLVSVNFQPSSASTPSGYVADTSEVYASRGNGFTYGWDVAFDHTRERNQDADKRRDTLNHMQKNGSEYVWEMELPNGTYELNLTAGDPGFDDGFMHIVAEEGTANEVDVVNGSAVGVNFVSGTTLVSVSDGRLTLSSGAQAVNNKICFVDISSVITEKPTVTISLNASSVSETDGLAMNLRIARSGSVAGNLTVGIIASGTATDGIDIDSTLSGQHVIPSGASFIDIPFNIVEDTLAEGTESLSVAIVSGNYLVASPSILSLGIEDSSFDDWRLNNFGRSVTRISADGDAEGDYDGDGVANVLEYAMGADPTAQDADLTQPTVTINNDKLNVTYMRPQNLNGVSYKVLYSTDLQTWIDISGTYTENISPLGNLELVNLEEPLVNPGRDKWFIRTEVDLQGR